MNRIDELKALASLARTAVATLIAEADECWGAYRPSYLQDSIDFLDRRNMSYLADARALESVATERDQQIAELTAILIEGPVSYPGIARTVWDAGWRPPA